MSNFINKFIYNTTPFFRHAEACILCKTWKSQRGFCAACQQDLISLEDQARCPGCALTVTTPGLCGHCLKHPYAFDAVYAAHSYAYPLSYLIQAFKYQKRLSFAKPLAYQMLANIPPPTDALIPMPLHHKRLQTRGFNQAQILAGYLSKHTHIPLLTTAAIRIRDTPQQSQLDEQARHHNLRQAFYIPPGNIEGLTITLVDDVITSGASLHALAASLKKAGAKSVLCWVLARTPL